MNDPAISIVAEDPEWVAAEVPRLSGKAYEECAADGEILHDIEVGTKMANEETGIILAIFRWIMSPDATDPPEKQHFWKWRITVIIWALLILLGALVAASPILKAALGDVKQFLTTVLTGDPLQIPARAAARNRDGTTRIRCDWCWNCMDCASNGRGGMKLAEII